MNDSFSSNECQDHIFNILDEPAAVADVRRSSLTLPNFFTTAPPIVNFDPKSEGYTPGLNHYDSLAFNQALMNRNDDREYRNIFVGQPSPEVDGIIYYTVISYDQEGAF